MAEINEQAETITYSAYALKAHFRNREDVYIAIDTFLYFWDRYLRKIRIVTPDLMDSEMSRWPQAEVALCLGTG